jgi:hypothetical protein
MSADDLREAAEALGAEWSMLADRNAILCRTCMRPLTRETRTEPGFLPRLGWYDDARTDPLICFRAVDYRHVPLTDREWAYYEAGARSVAAPAEPDAGLPDRARGGRPVTPATADVLANLRATSATDEAARWARLLKGKP